VRERQRATNDIDELRIEAVGKNSRGGRRGRSIEGNRGKQARELKFGEREMALQQQPSVSEGGGRGCG
jgi:hypothetical protein